MRAARQHRMFGIVAASLAVHLILVALVAVQAPRLAIPPPAKGPPEPVIPILIMPRAPPAATTPGAKPQPIRLHRRPQRFAPQPSPIPPLIVPAPTPERAPPRGQMKGPPTPLTPEQQRAAGVQSALRGKIGCANADAVGLSRSEREACEDAFAAGARQAPFPGLGQNADKADALGSAAERKDAYVRYRNGNMPSGNMAGRSDPMEPWKPPNPF